MIEGVRSREDTVDSGVPQGTVMGPLLFLIHISDLPIVLDPNTAVRLFADDCLVYRSIDGIEDQLGLQRDLDALVLWGACWGMKFNAAKCNIIHMGKLRFHFFYHLNFQVLQIVPHATYLGITLTSDLTWRKHIESTASKARQRLGFVKRNLRGAPYRCRETAYITLIRSQMEYCGDIWDPNFKKDSDLLEKVQRKAARWARGKEFSECSVGRLLKDLRWAPLVDRRRDQRLILFFKLLDPAHKSGTLDKTSLDLKFEDRALLRGNSNPRSLVRPKPKWKSSPLWKSTVIRTIPQWNNLLAYQVEADILTTFKCRLACPSP